MLDLSMLLYRRLFSATKGYILWHNIVCRNQLPNDCAVIMIPSPTDEECAAYSVKHLKELFRSTQFNCAVFLSNYMGLNELICRFQMRKEIKQVITLSDKQLEQILDFFNANLGDPRFIVASLNIPHGRNGLDYLRSGLLSKEEIFLSGIYNVTDGPQPRRIERMHNESLRGKKNI